MLLLYHKCAPGKSFRSSLFRLSVCLSGRDFLLLLQKEAKQGKGEPGFPLCKPLCRLAVLATDLDFSRSKNPNPYCAQMRSKGSYGVSAPTALRCPKKSSRCSLARFFRPLRVLRLAASATGGARLRTPYPSPAAGEGPSGQIAAYPTHSLDSVTSCYRFAVTPIKCAAGTL